MKSKQEEKIVEGGCGRGRQEIIDSADNFGICIGAMLILLFYALIETYGDLLWLVVK